MAVWVWVEQANFSRFILMTLIGVPVLMGAVFFWARIRPVRRAMLLVVGLPLLIAVISGAEPLYRVLQRFDDGHRGVYIVEENGIHLVWAPAGPGWNPDGNMNWSEAMDQVRYLSEDGLRLEDEPQDVWRLPTRGEVVASLTRTNLNCGGEWNTETETARFRIRPDKESPIWIPFSPVIYLWTSEEAEDGRAWIVVYHGGVFSKPKGMGAASLGFRAVRKP